MAIKARYTRILVDGADLSSQNNNVTVSVNTDNQDVTTFQATARAFLTMDPEGSIQHDGYFDSAAMEAQLEDIIANNDAVYVGVGFGTGTNGYPIYVLKNSPAAGLTVNSAVGDVITVSGSWATGEGLQRAIELYTGAVAATGALTGRDLGAAGSAGGAVYVWVTSITGTATDAVITVESDSANTFATAALEATVTFSATGGYAAAMTGVIGRYVRVNVTDLGGATGFTFVCAVVVDGVTQ
jgi:hypothetical protein